MHKTSCLYQDAVNKGATMHETRHCCKNLNIINKLQHDKGGKTNVLTRMSWKPDTYICWWQSTEVKTAVVDWEHEPGVTATRG